MGERMMGSRLLYAGKFGGEAPRAAQGVAVLNLGCRVALRAAGRSSAPDARGSGSGAAQPCRWTPCRRPIVSDSPRPPGSRGRLALTPQRLYMPNCVRTTLAPG